MICINLIDLFFLLLEWVNWFNYMVVYMIFEKLKGQKLLFGLCLFDVYWYSQVVKFFNYKLKWLGIDVVVWEIVEFDMGYYI